MSHPARSRCACFARRAPSESAPLSPHPHAPPRLSGTGMACPLPGARSSAAHHCADMELSAARPASTSRLRRVRVLSCALARGSAAGQHATLADIRRTSSPCRLPPKHHNCGAAPHGPPPAAPSTKSESSSPRLNGGRSAAGFSLFRDAPAPTILRRADMRRRRRHPAPPRTPAEQKLGAEGGARVSESPWPGLAGSAFPWRR
mmetsp:Transcript_47985/g.113626  ORF Transcript_47985/g.113626 Transcript_47985/m.113626 type:complete len:203 (+) Transcript_47985:30-638(+)